ncbi:5749_t:CDS:2, partial [Paraglomus occultum]
GPELSQTTDTVPTNASGNPVSAPSGTKSSRCADIELWMSQTTGTAAVHMPTNASSNILRRVSSNLKGCVVVKTGPRVVSDHSHLCRPTRPAIPSHTIQHRVVDLSATQPAKKTQYGNKTCYEIKSHTSRNVRSKREPDIVDRGGWLKLMVSSR